MAVNVVGLQHYLPHQNSLDFTGCPNYVWAYRHKIISESQRQGQPLNRAITPLPSKKRALLADGFTKHQANYVKI
jgi:hypothetical protein